MHIMIDIETMSLAPNAAPVSIGAVLMTYRGEEVDNFYRSITLSSSTDAGLHIDADTVMWWMQQSDRARGALAVQARPLTEVLREFSKWADVCEPSGGLGGVWGNGATADNVWLAEAYRAVGFPRPWSYKKDRCYRTFRAIHSDVTDPASNESEHDALADARWQASFMRKVCAEKGIVLA